MSDRGRIEAARQAVWNVDGCNADEDPDEVDARAALSAADAWDSAHGYVRVRLDEALTEKIAKTLHVARGGCWDRPQGEHRCVEWRWERKSAEAVVAALREVAGQSS